MEETPYIRTCDRFSDKLRKIEALSRQEPGYQAWCAMLQETEEAFDAFARQQPEEIQDMLYDYAEICQRIAQRKLNAACRYMDFLDPRLRE